MFNLKTKIQSGLTLMEVLIVIAIIGIIASISVGVLSGLAKRQSLEKEVAIALSEIMRARADAINSIGYSEHGIAFGTGSVTRFNAKTEGTATEIKVTDFSGSVTVSSIVLSGGVSSLYFQKISGKPSATGTVTLRAQGGEEKTIVIYGTGLAEVQ